MTGALVWTMLATMGCGGEAATAAVDTTPEPLTIAQCDVCGMMVAEQPAPRGQVIYRDGTRAHFCSLGELRAGLQAPSPHGSAVATWVESLPADFDPATSTTAPMPWVDSEAAWYGYGLERPLVMGLPILSFADEATARSSAARLGLTVTPWPALRDTPFNQLP